MDYLDDFRVFYNKTIYPELSRMERLRRRLLRNFLIAVVATSVLIFVGFFTGIPAVGWLVVVLSVMLWVSYGGRVYTYASVFKPNVIRLIIDFIDNRVNFSDLQYEEKKLIPKDQFNASYIFPTEYDEYYGEDYIWGKIGELPFEMCELFVQRISPVRERMDVVFRGIFLKATFSQDMGRGILVIPRDQKPQLGAAIQRFAAMGGKNVDSTIDNPDFGKVFTILATPDSSYVGVLSHEMETAIFNYQNATGKHVYLSFIGKDMFVAVTQDRDMMEPPYLRNNISYDLIREFYDDLVLLMGIVLDFDTNN